MTSDGACFSAFTTFGIDWRDARVECLLKGYDLASFTSSQENGLISAASTEVDCWIGLNDIEGGRYFFSWIDGSDSPFRLWFAHGGPNYLENCMESHDYYWRNVRCTDTRSCYFCRADSKYNCVYLCVGSSPVYYSKLNIWSWWFNHCDSLLIFSLYVL